MIHALPTLDDDTRGRLLRQARVATEVALVALLAFQAARLAWKLAVPPAPVGAMTALERAPTPTAGFIDAFHPATQADAGEADDRMAGFRVHGLRVDPAPGGTLGAAIIAGPDQSQQAYRVGDAIADGIVLAKVEPGYAVLRRGGRDVRLALVAGPDAPSGTAGARLPASPRGGGAPAVTPPDAEPVALAPAQLMSQAGMRATLDGGYALVPRGDGAFFRQAGLEPGDVLVAVDGRPLDLERLRGLEAELGTRASTVLTVKRGDQTRTITMQATPP